MIIEKVRELLEPIAEKREYYIVDIAYKREGGNFVLRVVLDKKGGITMDECTALNNELGEILDKENVIGDEYTLEVASPGLDRRLKKDSDFVWAIGKRVRVTTYAPVEGKNSFLGVLVGLGDGTVVVDEGAASIEIPREKIAGARIQIEGFSHEQ